MFKNFRILRLAAREAMMRRHLPRIPEPTAEMDTEESIIGFHNEGQTSLLPIYDFNARAIDALAPPGAQVLDLGSGSGVFLGYVAKHRPDLRIVGLDFAPGMVRVGNEALARAGLSDRVTLLRGDMRRFTHAVAERIDLISCVFALHHLTTRRDLQTCLEEIGRVVARQNARLWIFDHARPRRRKTAKEVPQIFTPTASPAFREDSYNSLCASWTFEELNGALRAVLPRRLRGCKANFLPLYQIHWLDQAGDAVNRSAWAETNDLPAAVRHEANMLSRLFPSAPQRFSTAPDAE